MNWNMESNNQSTNGTDEVENLPEPSTNISENIKKIMPENKTEIITEIKTEIKTEIIPENKTEITPEIIPEIKTEITPDVIRIEWVVGYFENEKLYSVIPSNWLLNVKDTWYSKWPNSSIKSTVQARIINATDPAKTWKYYPVKIMKRYDSYYEAEQETFSCLSVVDQDSLGRGKRKKKSNFRHFELSGDSDSESTVSVKTRGRPKKIARKSITQDTKNVASSSNKSGKHQESCSSQSSSTKVQKNSTTCLESSNSNSSNIFTRRKKENLKKENDKFMEVVFECIDRIDKNLNELGKVLIKRKVEAITRDTLKKSKQEPFVKTKQESFAKPKQESFAKSKQESFVKKKQEPLVKTKQEPSVKKKQESSVVINQEPLVKTIEETVINIKQEPLDEMDTYDEVEINTFDTEFLSNFPMTELDDIINVELRIVNCSEFKEKFISYLTSIGGVDIKNFVKRILSQSFTNRLATQCTWRGYHGNFELQKLNMIKTMCDVSKSIFGNTIETAFEVYVKEWFRRGKQRYSRQINTVKAKAAA